RRALPGTPRPPTIVMLASVGRTELASWGAIDPVAPLLQLGALVLHGPFDVLPQGSGGNERPVGLSQELAGQEDQVGLTGANDLVGLSWIGNHAHSAGRHPAVAANLIGEPNLVARTKRNAYAGHVAARGAVEQVNPQRRENFGQRH